MFFSLFFQAKQRASIKWLLSKAYDHKTPEELREPFYKDHDVSFGCTKIKLCWRISVWTNLTECVFNSECGYLFIFFLFCVFRVTLRVHESAYRLVFTNSLHSLAGQSCDQQIDELSYSASVHRVIRPARKENDFASKVPERESNSSYTARVDPFPSALSTRPMFLSHPSLMLIIFCWDHCPLIWPFNHALSVL